ncbi:MAG TPA: T9SS type A sorting domain-containing protein, partial [Bacteroidia bacterium]|nr:T9SS type A sorting domain-containing protein [Bacteroidia bacterium]
IANDSVQITVTANPDTIYANGDSATLSVYSPVPGTYLWAPSGATTQSITVTPAATSTYTVVVSTVCGTYTSAVTVYNFNCTNTYDEPICLVTIDTASNWPEIIWGRTNSPPQGGFGYYYFYRDTISGYKFIGGLPLTDYTAAIDAHWPSWFGPASYELSTFDSCGESALSAPATSVFLTTTAGVNAYILNWTAYVGFIPTEYRIFRATSSGPLTLIDSVLNTVLTYTDSFPPYGSNYAIQAVSPYGPCTPTAKFFHNKVGASLSGSFSNKFNTEVLGTQSLKSNDRQLTIYPNPTNGNLSLNYSTNSSGNVQISIIDELGQIVYTTNETKVAGNYNEQLNLENLASGIYTLRMQTAGGTTVKKVIIMHNKLR